MDNKYYPMNSAEVLDQVLSVYKKSFLKQLVVSTVFSIIFFVGFYLLLIVGIFVLVAGFASAGLGTGIGAGMIITIGALLIFLVLGISIYEALTATGVALITKHTFLGEYCDVWGVLKASFKKILIATTAALANLIVLIPVIALAAFLVYIYIVTIIGFGNMEGTPGGPIIAATIVLILLMLALSLVLATITMMSMSVAIFEGRWFFGAVMRSFQLVKQDFMRIMGLVAIWFLITFGITISLETLFSVGPSLLMYFFPEEAAGFVFLSTFIFGSLFSIAVGVVVAPLSGIFSTMVYINQRIKLEGMDIELNLNALEVKRNYDERNEHDIRERHERGVE
ncbi:MAG: hypothetical protein FWE24_03005 [Defluviitaleaceae bacterium]|nr:hypothetical protein [Defluviitaleaceae bacterium]